MFVALNTIIPIMSRCNKSSLCYNTFHALPLIPNTLLMDQLILDNNALFCKVLIWCSLPDTHTLIDCPKFWYWYKRYLHLYYDEQLWLFSKNIGQNNNGQSWSNVSFPYKALTSTNIFHKRRRKRFLNSAVELNIMSIHCSWGNLRANTLVGFQCLDRGRRFLFWVHQSSGFFNSWNRIL